MIIKGQSRGRAKQLARHLLSTADNERIQIYECRGTISQSVEGALTEMEAFGKLGRSARPLYHASISPRASEAMNAEQLAAAVNLLEEKLGFGGQPRLVIIHRKLGREHAHVVWSRIDRSGKSIADSWNYARHEEAAREIETMFGHAPVDDSRKRRGKASQEYELRQSGRSGIELKRVQDDLASAWEECETGADFQRRIEEAGYRLVRGDRRGYVVLDKAGEAHSLARRLGIKAKQLTIKMESVDLARLPDVQTGRLAQRHKHRKRSYHRLSVITFNIAHGRNSRSINARIGSGLNYGAQRASIISDFAAKIADACSSGQRGEEIAARIRRLRDEELATLAALKAKERGPLSNRSVRGIYRKAAREVTARRTRNRKMTVSAQFNS